MVGARLEDQRYSELTARYVLFCSLEGISIRLGGDHRTAVDWASRGADLKASAGLDTANDCGHTLRLARRDSGDVRPALTYFLYGEKLEKVTAVGEPDVNRGGPFTETWDVVFSSRAGWMSFICIKKSAILLEKP